VRIFFCCVSCSYEIQHSKQNWIIDIMISTTNLQYLLLYKNLEHSLHSARILICARTLLCSNFVIAYEIWIPRSVIARFIFSAVIIRYRNPHTLCSHSIQRVVVSESCHSEKSCKSGRVDGSSGGWMWYAVLMLGIRFPSNNLNIAPIRQAVGSAVWIINVQTLWSVLGEAMHALRSAAKIDGHKVHKVFILT
jgi:hypothetical protein